MAHQEGANVNLVIDTETAYKTAPSPANGMLLPYLTETVRLNREQTHSQTIRSGRQPQKPGRGNEDISGDINFELSPQYGRTLTHTFGGYGKTGAEAPYTHTWKIGTLPVGMMIEKQFTDLAVPKYVQYNGCKVNSFKLSGKGSGMVPCSVSILGAKETVASSAHDASVTDLGHTPFDGHEASITQGGSPLATVTGIELSLENGHDGDTYVMDGTGQRYSLPAGVALVHGKVTCLFLDMVLYGLALAHTETTLEVHFTKGLGTGASAGNEKLSFYMDECIFKPTSPVVSGPKGLLVELGFEAYYNAGANASALRAVLLSPIATF